MVHVYDFTVLIILDIILYICHAQLLALIDVWCTLHAVQQYSKHLCRFHSVLPVIAPS